MHTYKGVDFAYPTSTSAAKFGHTRTGCYTVSVYSYPNGSLVKRTPFASLNKAEAFAYAAKLEQPWGTPWLRFCADDIKAAHTDAQ